MTAAETLLAEFKSTADAMHWPPEVQVGILAAFITRNANVDAFCAFLLEVVEQQLASVPQAVPTQTGTTQPAVSQSESQHALPAEESLTESYAFFERDLTRRALATLTQLPITASDNTSVQDVATLTVPAAAWDAARAQLQSKPGQILFGWYCTFQDGAVAAIAITAGANTDTAYIDAFMVLPDGKFPTDVNPSLPPTTTLDAPFVFNYPDGTTRTIQLVRGA